MEMIKKINNCQGFRKKKLRKCNLLEIRKKFSNEGLERRVSIKSTCYATMGIWVWIPASTWKTGYSLMHACNLCPYPQYCVGQRQEGPRAWWPLAFQAQGETLPHRNKSESDRRHSVSSSSLHGCRQARVPTYTNPQRTHTHKSSKVTYNQSSVNKRSLAMYVTR